MRAGRRAGGVGQLLEPLAPGARRARAQQRRSRRRRSATSDRGCRARSLPGRDEAASRGKDGPIVVTPVRRRNRPIYVRSPRGPPSRPRSRAGRAGTRPSAGTAGPASRGRRRGSARRSRRCRAGRHCRTWTSSCRISRGESDRPLPHEHEAARAWSRSAPGSRPPSRSRAPRRRAARCRTASSSSSEQLGGEAACGRRRCAGRRDPSPRAGRRSAGGPSSSSFTRGSRPSSSSVTSSRVSTPMRASAATRRVSADSGMRSRSASASALSSSAPRRTSSSASATTAPSWPGSSVEHLPERRLVAGGEQRGERVLRLGGQQPGDELPHVGLGLGADEAVDDLAVLQRVHGRDALHLERRGRLAVGVDVDLGEDDLAAGLVDHLLEDRSERLARAAPLRPEVDHHRHLLRALHHLGGEGGVGDVDRHGWQCTGGGTLAHLGRRAPGEDG